MSVTFQEVLNFINKNNNENKNIKTCVKNPEDFNIKISDVISDSREVKSGTLFACIKGENSDGHKFAKIAEDNGACALLCEREIDSKLPQIIVERVRDFLGLVAAFVYDNPCEKLLMVGVTGTNGKTTTTYIIRSILQAAGIRTGLLGTIIESDGINEKEADRTTPESCEIQKQLASMVKNNCGACVMETSSHGLFLGRIKGTRYDVPVFTNLYPEHLDFHLDMENYFAAKKLLFTDYTKENFQGAANFDDPYGKRLIEEFGTNIRGFGLKQIPNIKMSLSCTELEIQAGILAARGTFFLSYGRPIFFQHAGCRNFPELVLASRKTVGANRLFALGDVFRPGQSERCGGVLAE